MIRRMREDYMMKKYLSKDNQIDGQKQGRSKNMKYESRGTVTTHRFDSLRKLRDIIREAVEKGRLSREDIPEDFDSVQAALEKIRDIEVDGKQLRNHTPVTISVPELANYYISVTIEDKLMSSVITDRMVPGQTRTYSIGSGKELNIKRKNWENK